MENVKSESINVEFLPKGISDPRFQQRESGVSHTPYRFEVLFYTYVKNGDISGIERMMSHFIDNALVVGRMSDDNIRQAQYFAVSCITLATRYAIEGGLPESEAYNLSDSYIQSIDKMGATDEILQFLSSKAAELTSLVRQNRKRLEYPPHVRKAMKYINAHLHERIKCADVAKECNVGEDYLSARFKKYVGDTLSHYILKQKLEESKTLLFNGCEYGEIGYYLGFCSQTHYISCFKKEYGMTPKQFAKRNVLS